MDDLISRQAAIELILSGKVGDDSTEWVGVECPEECNSFLDWAAEEVGKMPSAQPEPLTINFAQELDRETIEKVKEIMKNAPVLIMAVNDDSAEPERKKGRWITKSTNGEMSDVCSACGYVEWDEPHNYCPNCGAEMVKSDE